MKRACIAASDISQGHNWCCIFKKVQYRPKSLHTVIADISHGQNWCCVFKKVQYRSMSLHIAAWIWNITRTKLVLCIQNCSIWNITRTKLVLCIQKGAISPMSLHVAASDILQLMLYKTTIHPVLDYGDIIYDPCLKSESEAIETFQSKAALVCTGAFRITSNDRLLNELCWEKMENRRAVYRQILVYKIVDSLSPPYLRQICNLIPHNTNAYNLRRNNSILVPFIRK